MIRRMNGGDKAAYMRMAGEFYDSGAALAEVSRAHFEAAFEEMQKGDTYIEGYITQTGGEIAGYMLLTKCFSAEAGGMELWLDEIYVRPEFRGRGLASEMLHFMQENYARKIRRFRIEADPQNHKAAALYLRFGFEPLLYAEYKKDTACMQAEVNDEHAVE